MIHAFVAGFARALLFLATVVVFGTIAMVVMPGRGGHYLINWAWIICSVALAWFVSGVPFYIHRMKQRAMIRRWAA